MSESNYKEGNTNTLMVESENKPLPSSDYSICGPQFIKNEQALKIPYVPWGAMKTEIHDDFGVSHS